MYRLGPRPPYRGCMAPIVHGLVISAGGVPCSSLLSPAGPSLSSFASWPPSSPRRDEGRSSRRADAPKRRIRSLCPCAPAWSVPCEGKPVGPGHRQRTIRSRVRTRQKRRADHGCWTRPPRFRGKPLTHLRWRTAPLVAHAEESCAVGMPYTRGELRSITTELLDAGAVHAA